MKTKSSAGAAAARYVRMAPQLPRSIGLSIRVAGTFLIFAFLGDPEVSGEQDACRQSAADALASCQSGAQSAYQLALGKCDNRSNPAGRDKCEKRAARHLQNALALCNGQDTLRQNVCQRLGGGTYEPQVDPANFSNVIDNPYFPLKPGTTFIYEGQTPEGFEHVRFAVTHQTRVILGVTCVEVHDSRLIDGILTEDTRDWFAQDKAGNVWYFGENTTLVDRGLPVDLSGSWTAGVEAARPGIVMKAQPTVGQFYRQEYSLGNAEDLAEVKALDAQAAVPYGSFDHCVKTLESSPLAPGDLENKFYAAGVGNVLTIDRAGGERSELVDIKTE